MNWVMMICLCMTVWLQINHHRRMFRWILAIPEAPTPLDCFNLLVKIQDDFNSASDRCEAVVNFQHRTLIFNYASLIQSQILELMTPASILETAGLQNKGPQGPEGC